MATNPHHVLKPRGAADSDGGCGLPIGEIKMAIDMKKQMLWESVADAQLWMVDENIGIVGVAA